MHQGRVSRDFGDNVDKVEVFFLEQFFRVAINTGDTKSFGYLFRLWHSAVVRGY